MSDIFETLSFYPKRTTKNKSIIILFNALTYYLRWWFNVVKQYACVLNSQLRDLKQ